MSGTGMFAARSTLCSCTTVASFLRLSVFSSNSESAALSYDESSETSSSSFSFSESIIISASYSFSCSFFHKICRICRLLTGLFLSLLTVCLLLAWAVFRATLIFFLRWQARMHLLRDRNNIIANEMNSCRARQTMSE